MMATLAFKELNFRQVDIAMKYFSQSLFSRRLEQSNSLIIPIF